MTHKNNNIMVTAQLKYFFVSNYYYLKNLLIGDTTAAVAIKHLEQISSPIRFFVTRGPGFGDQVGTLNLIDNLESYSGTIEIIGNYSESNPETSLRKMMKLCNVNIPLSHGVLSTELSTGRKVTFMSLDYFKTHAKNEVDLAVFFGISSGILHDYDPRKYNTTSFTDVAKSKEVLFFDPFTVVQPFNSELPGFALQHKYQPIKRYPAANNLPYKLLKPSRELVKKELASFAKFNPRKADMIRTIFKEQSANKMHTVTPYGLNIILNPAPQYALLNQILSAAAANIGSNKPLSVVILNNLPNHQWKILQDLFDSSHLPLLNQTLNFIKSKYTISFVDVMHNNTISKHNNALNVINLGEIPQKLFNELLINSTFLATYEGANTGTLLDNYQLWGLACKRYNWDIFTDFHILPEKLQKVAPLACAQNDLAWKKTPTPVDQLAPIYKQYLNETRPPMLSPDRMSFALSKLEQTKNTNTALAFFKPRENFGAVLYLHGATSVQYGLYGALEQLTTESLMRGLSLSETTASTVSSIARLTIQLLQDDSDVHFYAMTFLFTALLYRANMPYATILPATFIFLMSNIHHILNFDNDVMLLLASLAATSIVTELAVKKAIRYLFSDNVDVIEQALENSLDDTQRNQGRFKTL